MAPCSSLLPSSTLRLKRILLLLLVVALSTLVVSAFFFPVRLSSLSPRLQRDCPPMPLGAASVPPSHLYPLPLNATLDQRIAAFRNAPGVGWEPADFVQWNLETCGNVVPNHNKDLLAKSSLLWAGLNASTIIQHRERMARFLEEQRDAGAFEDMPVARGGRGLVGEGQGIVFTAGNADTLARVVTTLRVLRHVHGCHLPAAIFHFPSERPSPTSPLLIELASLNAKLVEATGRARDDSREKNYQLKAMSIVEAEWAEVIYLDSDNLPTTSPTLLLSSPGYIRLGAFFTPDYWKTSASNPVWQILGVQCRDEWEQEAGQIIVDKRRNLDAMLLAGYMLREWRFWFGLSDGDKDVFRFAFLALRKRWALPGRFVGAAGLPSGTASGAFCAHTMLQYDHAARPLFVHYNLLKQIPSGVYLGYTWGRTKQVAGQGEEASSLDHEVDDAVSESRAPFPPYPDPLMRGPHDVEADMLANADSTGRTIYTGTSEVRRRAVMEKGVRAFFHGGGNSAFCVDLRWERAWEGGENRKEGGEGEGDPLEVVQWRDDERLRDFERTAYEQGLEPMYKGG